MQHYPNINDLRPDAFLCYNFLPILSIMKTLDASRRQISVLRNMRRGKYRREQGLFLAEGKRTVAQIIENHKIEMLHLYLSEDRAEFLLPAFGEDQPGPVYLLPPDVFDEIADTQHSQGVFALCRIPEMSERSRWSEPEGCLIVLDGVRDPGNMGTLIRTAAWFGAAGIILSGDTVDPFHPKVVRSTAGATGSLPWCIAEPGEALEELAGRGWKILFLEDRPGSVPLSEELAGNGLCLVIGSEAHGIRIDRRKLSGTSVKIPGAGGRAGVESLNVSVAGAVALYVLLK